jgi:hypothetical protein
MFSEINKLDEDGHGLILVPEHILNLILGRSPRYIVTTE